VLPDGRVALLTNAGLLLVHAPGFAQLDGAAEIGEGAECALPLHASALHACLVTCTQVCSSGNGNTTRAAAAGSMVLVLWCASAGAVQQMARDAAGYASHRPPLFLKPSVQAP